MEKWKAIPGYEGLYEASNQGRIRTVKRSYINNLGIEIHVDQKIIKQRYFIRKKRRNAVVNLNNHGVKKAKSVPRMIAMAWCPGYKEGLTVNHIDGNTLNNCAENLEWLSNEKNIKQGHRTGLYNGMYKKCSLIDQDGEIKHFDRQIDASRFLGRGNSYIATLVYLHRKNAYSINGDRYDLA